VGCGQRSLDGVDVSSRRVCVFVCAIPCALLLQLRWAPPFMCVARLSRAPLPFTGKDSKDHSGTAPYEGVRKRARPTGVLQADGVADCNAPRCCAVVDTAQGVSCGVALSLCARECACFCACVLHVGARGHAYCTGGAASHNALNGLPLREIGCRLRSQALVES
jgi:hypothetical protein